MLLRSVAGVGLAVALASGVAASADSRASDTTPVATVAVMPFNSVAGNSPATPDWVSTAVQQNLASDLARFHFRPIEALATPDGVHAPRYRIEGTYQTTDDNIRFTGQIIDSSNGSSVGGLTATGSMRDLFALEDELSMQAVHQLNRLMQPAANAPAGGPIVAPVFPPAAADPAMPAIGSDTYDGSALQAFVNSNSPPSNDYWDQLAASRNRQMYGSYPVANNAYGYGYGNGPGLGGLFPGSGYYPGIIGFPYYGGYFGGAYGGFGYGGYGSIGFGYGSYGSGGFGGGYHGHGGYSRR